MVAVKENVKEWLTMPLSDFSEHEYLLYQYGKSFMKEGDALSEHYELKMSHTAMVVKNARILAEKETIFFKSSLTRALLLAALYHDIGRFSQIKMYGTFADALSYNHGLLGVKTLRQQGFIADEPHVLQRLITIAVGLHNRYMIPCGVQNDERHILLGVRDADKLDILRIMGGQLGKGCVHDPLIVMHVKDAPEKYTPKLLDQLESSQPPSFADMHYVNDFRLLLCAWVKEIYFTSSREILAKEGYLTRIIGGMTELPNIQKKVSCFIEKILKQ